MRPTISEFSYGFLVTHELLHGVAHGVSIAPIFPSLRDEADLGYDVKIGPSDRLLFLQFKLSEYLERNNAREADEIALPYYRMALYPARHSNQHEALLSLNEGGELVYYAVPRFHTEEEMDDAFSNNSVLQRSAFFTPIEIGPLPDGDNHYVVFNHSQNAKLCSSPKEIDGESITFESFLSRVIFHAQNGKRKVYNSRDQSELLEIVIAAIEVNLKKSFYSALFTDFASSSLSKLGQISFLSNVFLGCALYRIRSHQAAD